MEGESVGPYQVDLAGGRLQDVAGGSFCHVPSEVAPWFLFGGCAPTAPW